MTEVKFQSNFESKLKNQRFQVDHKSVAHSKGFYSKIHPLIPPPNNPIKTIENLFVGCNYRALAMAPLDQKQGWQFAWEGRGSREDDMRIISFHTPTEHIEFSAALSLTWA